MKMQRNKNLSARNKSRYANLTNAASCV